VCDSLWNHIWLPGRDELISVVTARSFRGYTDIILTIAATLHVWPLAIEILLYSLLESMLQSLFDSQLQRVAV
jgi:hypothetical protein